MRMGADAFAVCVLVLGSICLGAFLWATRKHFLVGGRMPIGMRMVTWLSLAGAGWFVVRVLADGVGAGAPFAIPMMALAVGLFGWTVRTTRERRLPIAFSDELPSFVYGTGPYRYVRHPFYLSYIIFWIGTSVATQGIWGWTVPLVMSGIYIHLARREERGLRASRLAGVYERYRKHTAMFVPSVPLRRACEEGT
jgi:protein-S-isoprenylcysteine O-methyltransferase Ste14